LNLKYKDYISNAVNENISLQKIVDKDFSSQIIVFAEIISKCLLSGNTIFWCGNGGSAADSQHMAAEFVVRFKSNRRALKSVALTTDTSIITSIVNDFSSKEIFSRQIEAIANQGDILFSLSTSGMSENIIHAIEKCKENKICTLSLLGNNGGTAGKISDFSIIVPSTITARIQEIHIMICHLLCEIIEDQLGF
tara:strand:+ start:1727 stop:2308 length:582 start_codon:yes stop_codon:yes gene_type:complete